MKDGIRTTPVDDFEMNLCEATVRLGSLWKKIENSDRTSPQTKKTFREVYELVSKMTLQTWELRNYVSKYYLAEEENHLLRIHIRNMEKTLLLYDIATEKHDFEKLADLFAGSRPDTDKMLASVTSRLKDLRKQQRTGQVYNSEEQQP